MRVLIVSAFPPDPAPEANHALHISEHLAEAGLDVHVLCKRGSIATGTRQGIVVHPIIADWTWSDLPRLVRCMRQSRPDVVLLLYIGWVYDHHPMITFLPTICKAVLPGVPCVTQFEIVDSRTRPRSLLTRALRKAAALWAGGKDVHFLFGTLLRDSARIIALSSPHRARLVAHDPAVEEKSVILPPPPLIRVCNDDSLSTRQRAREAIGAAENDFVLVYWGYIYPGKGVETLLEALRIVCDRRPNMRLLIVGGSLDFPTEPISCSDYFRMVRQLPEKLGIAERVVWTGHFNWDSDAGSRYLHAGDLCVLPFDYGVTLNNSSLAAAGTHGLPVIATELPAGRDEALEHGRNIYLCRPCDPENLAEAIELVSQTADLRERLRAGILALARDWHRWDTTTQRLVGILESAVSGADPGGRSAIQAGDGSSSEASELGNAVEDDRSTPLVSVIVAVYDVAKYLSQCLDSLVNQTLKSIEIIVVNDASHDESARIIEEYRARYPDLLRVVTCQRNKGLASVRNVGMKLARGEYIGFTDGDDWADIRMCELMYQRARDDSADVVIADATVFYEDSKTFGRFFDQHIRETLDPRLRTMPFELGRDPRVMLLEPVAWTKLYRRSFLEKHGLQFEEGMNSYEDICFHFSVLLKAAKISLLETALVFYRQNRPGQISGRRSRKIFEVFAVFDRIQRNLAAWNVSAEIWALLVKVQLRQLEWLLKDRVQSRHRREFFASAAKQLKTIPESGFTSFARQATAVEAAKVLCMRRNRLRAYEKIVQGGLPRVALVQGMVRTRRRLLARVYRVGRGMLRERVATVARPFVSRLLDLARFEQRLQAVEEGLDRLTRMQEFTSRGEEPLVEICRIGDQVLLLARCDEAGLASVVERMKTDCYLTQTAVFREGDTVIDVGAHIGVVSIFLAKKYPFITVYAVEPEPTNYQCLKRNIELNSATNVIAINKAVSGDGTRRTLYANPWLSTWATIDARLATGQRVIRTMPVDTVTLDQLLDEYQIRHCRVVKITAPGAVQESLRGFTRSGSVDLLCGEVDVDDCSRPRLEVASWRIARQHFWRTLARRGNGTVSSWVHEMPNGLPRAIPETTSTRGGGL